MVKWSWMIAASFLLVAAACGDDDGGDKPTGAAPPTEEVAKLDVTSSAFADGAEIPVEYTCDGDEIPFPLSWSGDPGETQSLALIFDDPDAPGDEPYVHWLMYDIPANMSGFESVSKDERLPNGAAQGENSRGESGYAGPCPPGGQTHTYVMTVYALDRTLGLEPGASRNDLETAMEGHVLASGELTGTFGR
jgi:Raf kinase inhibitor-like YbhB/YbcL family protein